MAATGNRKLNRFLAGFVGKKNGDAVTETGIVRFGDESIPLYRNSFWTSGQRQAASIHEISYRACFKPQLPRFFIDLLTRKGDLVYDPFSGRGTTVIEAGLAGRSVAANDANPLSRIMTEPRFSPPAFDAVKRRLEVIPHDGGDTGIDLSMFYEAGTGREIAGLREYLLGRREDGTLDATDSWIAMVATNRLTGHSPGFFSVYTLPPNQAVSPESQKRINIRKKQEPVYRDTHALILKKTKSLLSGLRPVQVKNLKVAGRIAMFLTGDARATPEIRDGSVRLTVTSPPFLDIVQYRDDNWLRCWFNGLDARAIGKKITMARSIDGWTSVMGGVFCELSRITAPGGWIAFEVGEVRKGTVRLEESVIPIGINAGLSCRAVMINAQEFTKTSHIWGVDNMGCGTNTNRIAVFQKPGR